MYSLHRNSEKNTQKNKLRKLTKALENDCY